MEYRRRAWRAKDTNKFPIGKINIKKGAAKPVAAPLHIKNRVYEKPLSLVLEAIERFFQIIVVEFEVGEFELERVVLSLKTICP